jgi:putative Mg2+ transporter-C (MgtC) family protein
MPLHPSWTDLGLRLALTFVAGIAIGLNREATGHAAGLRTTLLVCLAAGVSMIQTNLLLPVVGKPPDGFSVMDVMRLPLGILTGVGFIGGGAILRRGDLVIGVTTASTLWMATVVGLCLGGGQIVLGVVATGLTVAILWVMKAIDVRLPKGGRAVLLLAVKVGSGLDDLVPGDLGDVRLRILNRNWNPAEAGRVTRYEVNFKGDQRAVLDRLARLALQPDVTRLDWTLMNK